MTGFRLVMAICAEVFNQVLEWRWLAAPAIVVPKEAVMLWTISVVLIVLWLLGFVTSNTMGGLIHILLVIAIIMVLIRIIQGRKIL
jgi:hypothetical protein